MKCWNNLNFPSAFLKNNAIMFLLRFEYIVEHFEYYGILAMVVLWIPSPNSPIHLYTAPGIYNVTMIGFASITGCSDTISATIEIVDHPFASFSLNPIDGCIPLAVNLLSNSVGAAYYSWSMGNGDTIIGSQPIYVYTQSGQFTVSLIATDDNGCQDDTSFSYINVYLS
ncbi:MAG: hypothetical protein IPP71_09940 [Bacteroidetes bacterium]|nr:hypothetical protein [Bacteroidota bacterium]